MIDRLQVFSNSTNRENSFLKPQTLEGNKTAADAFEEILKALVPDRSVPQNLQQRFESLFEAARETIFEDGMESDFSKSLMGLINLHGKAAIKILKGILCDDQVNIEVAAEALRWIGKISNPDTHAIRRELLESCLLTSQYGRVRDGALLGLASLDDPKSIAAVRKAIDREKISELHTDLEQLLIQLEHTQTEGFH